MVNILTNTAPKSRPVVMVNDENKKDYADPLPIHPLFKVLLLTIYHACGAARRKNIQVDGSLPNDPKYAHQDVGFFEAQLDGGWYIVVNWTEDSRANLMPDYIGVDCKNESVAILGPHATIRTCWHCKATGYQDRAKKRPWAVPDKPCSNCGQLDWYNLKFKKEDLVIVASTKMAQVTGKNYLFDGFGGGAAEIELKRQALRERANSGTRVSLATPNPRGPGLILPPDLDLST